MSKMKKIVCAGVLGLSALATTAQADVIELALVLDESGSIGQSNFNLQTDAYKNIFTNNFYDTYMTAGDTLVVSAYTFGSNVTQTIGWTSITDNASAAAFGSLFSGSWYSGGWTATASAIDVAAAQMLGNGITSDKMIIDISTDGQPTCTRSGACGVSGTVDAIAAAGDALAAGIVTNAIGVGSGISEAVLDDITTAGGGFYKTATDFVAFQASLEEKLFREIQGKEIPVPAPLLLMTLGLVGLGMRKQLASK